MQKIKFTKMQGLGNDFILIMPDEFENVKDKFPQVSVELCDRRFGIGADGIFVPTLNETDADLGWLFYQSDGSTAQMCGNGMRCFARFVYDNKLVDKQKFSVKTGAGIIVPELLDNEQVKVNMAKPILEPAKIPFKGEKSLNCKLSVKDKDFVVNAVSMGNPHCVVFSDGDTKSEALNYGYALEHHPLFSEKTNVEFVKVLSRNEITVDVWERGCGITLACGTGACASAVAAILNGYCDKIVKVNLPGGVLTIEWEGNSQNTNFDVFMTGSADYSFEGVVSI